MKWLKSSAICGAALFLATSVYAQQPYTLKIGEIIKKENIKDIEVDAKMVKHQISGYIDSDQDGLLESIQDCVFYDRNHDGNSDLVKFILTHRKLPLTERYKSCKLKHPFATELIYWIDDDYDGKPDRIIHDISPEENIDATDGKTIIGADGIFDEERPVVNEGAPYFLHWDNEYSKN